MILEIVENNFGNNTIEHMSDQTNTIESQRALANKIIVRRVFSIAIL